jgi:hypothetical protein
MRWLAVLVVGTLLVAGCGSDRLTDEQSESLCTALSSGSWRAAEDRAMGLGLDHAKAEEAVRAAVRDSCPEYEYKIDI